MLFCITLIRERTVCIHLQTNLNVITQLVLYLAAEKERTLELLVAPVLVSPQECKPRLR